MWRCKIYRIPYLQLDLLAVYGDHSRPKLNADRQVMHLLEALISELEQQAGLSDAGVTDDDVSDAQGEEARRSSGPVSSRCQDARSDLACARGGVARGEDLGGGGSNRKVKS